MSSKHRLIRKHTILIAFVIAFCVAEVVGQNLINNGTFDTHVDGWSGSTGSLTVQHRTDLGSTLTGGSGPGCMEVSSTYLGGGHSGPVQAVDIAAGASYEFALTYYLPSGNNSADYVSASVIFENQEA